MTYTQLLRTHPGVAQTKILIHRPLLPKHSVSVYFYNLIQKVNQNCSGSEPNRFCEHPCDFRKWIFFQHLCGLFTNHYFQSQERKCTKERLGTGCTYILKVCDSSWLYFLYQPQSTLVTMIQEHTLSKAFFGREWLAPSDTHVLQVG